MIEEVPVGSYAPASSTHDSTQGSSTPASSTQEPAEPEPADAPEPAEPLEPVLEPAELEEPGSGASVPEAHPPPPVPKTRVPPKVKPKAKPKAEPTQVLAESAPKAKPKAKRAPKKTDGSSASVRNAQAPPDETDRFAIFEHRSDD